MTSGSQQIDQQYWLDHNTGLSYQINIYTPQPWQTRVEDLLTVPVQRRRARSTCGQPRSCSATSPS